MRLDTHTHTHTHMRGGGGGLKPSVDKGDCSVAIYEGCAIWREQCVCVCVCVCVWACRRRSQAIIMQLFNHQPTPLSFLPAVFILSSLPFPLFCIPTLSFQLPDNFGSVLFSWHSVPLSVKLFPLPPSSSLPYVLFFPARQLDFFLH